MKLVVKVRAMKDSDRARYWRLHLRSASAFWGKPGAAGLILLALVAGGHVASLSTLPSAQLYLRAELWLPLLVTLYAALALWPEYRSGSIRLLADLPQPLPIKFLVARTVVGAAVPLTAVGAGVLLGSVPVLVTSPGTLPGVFLAAAAMAPACLFLLTLGLAATLLLGHPAIGLLACVSYSVLDLKLGTAGNPALTMHGLACASEGMLHSELWPVGKIGLLAAVFPMLVSIRRSRGASILFPAAPGRVIPVAVLSVSLFLAVQLTWLVGRIPQSSAGRKGGLTGAVTQQSRAYWPLPISRCFGPVFHALARVPSGGSVEEDGRRVTALERIAGEEGSSPWTEGVLLDLADARTKLDAVAGLNDYWSLAEKYPQSPYAAVALSRIVETERIVWREAFSPLLPDNASNHATHHATLPIDVRIAASLRILELYTGDAVVSAANALEKLYPAAVRPDTIARAARLAAKADRPGLRRRWLLLAARAEADAGRLEEARRLATAVGTNGRVGEGARQLLTRLESE